MLCAFFEVEFHCHLWNAWTFHDAPGISWLVPVAAMAIKTYRESAQSVDVAPSIVSSSIVCLRWSMNIYVIVVYQ